MPTRTARTAWNGTLETGSGQVELSSSKVGTYDVSFPKRAADDAGGTTSPEELVAAAHSACFAMQFSALIAEAVGVHDRAPLQGFSDLSMNAAGALGGALAGPILALAGYSGLGLVTMLLVAVIVTWSALRLSTARRAR